MTDKIDLPDNGICPCGCKDLMLAKDQTEYTPVTKEDDGGWDRRGSYTEEACTDRPDGDVRLFCTACGQYFNLPEEL